MTVPQVFNSRERRTLSQVEAMDWVATLFEEPLERLSLQRRREEIPAWDSLGVLTLMAGLDGEFGITLSEDQIQEINSVAEILDVLRVHGAMSGR